MNDTQKIQAGELAIAISRGFADLPEVISWADNQIAATDEPEILLIDLSLVQKNSDALHILNSLSKGADIWLINSCFLKRFSSLKSLPIDESLQLAKDLYLLSAYEEGTPSHFHNFISHWDAISLAADGIYGDPEECIREFLKDVRYAVDAGIGVNSAKIDCKNKKPRPLSWPGSNSST